MHEKEQEAEESVCVCLSVLCVCLSLCVLCLCVFFVLFQCVSMSMRVGGCVRVCEFVYAFVFMCV